MSALGRIGRADPMRRRVLSGAGALAGLVLADVRQALAQAPVRPPGEAIPAPVGSALTQPRLAGEGRLRWFGLAIYDARLFVPVEGMDPARYARTPFALELQYARALAGEDIAQAWAGARWQPTARCAHRWRWSNCLCSCCCRRSTAARRDWTWR